MIKKITYCAILLLLAFADCHGQKTDTAGTLRQLAGWLKSCRNLEYRYTMDISFPNGEQDHLKGTVAVDMEHGRYLDNCDAFTMLYTGDWFYRADHRQKTLTIVNLAKKTNKKQQQETKQQIFQAAAISTFLDSVVLKKAGVKKLSYTGSSLTALLAFPKTESVRQVAIVYDTTQMLLTGYDITVAYPWQRTPKGVQVVETSMRCGEFRKDIDKSIYDEQNYFSFVNKSIELKKYKEYKLSGKI